MNAGPYFVTPHAVERFRERIAPLTYNQARVAIIHGLAETNSTPRRLTEGLATISGYGGRTHSVP